MQRQKPAECARCATCVFHFLFNLLAVYFASFCSVTIADIFLISKLVHAYIPIWTSKPWSLETCSTRFSQATRRSNHAGVGVQSSLRVGSMSHCSSPTLCAVAEGKSKGKHKHSGVKPQSRARGRWQHGLQIQVDRWKRSGVRGEVSQISSKAQSGSRCTGSEDVSAKTKIAVDTSNRTGHTSSQFQSRYQSCNRRDSVARLDKPLV